MGYLRHSSTSRQGAVGGDCHQPSCCPTSATPHLTHTRTRTCPGPLGVNLSAGPESKPGRRLRGLACRLLLLIVRLPSSCSLGLKVSSSGGLVAGMLRCKQPELGIIWHQLLPSPNSDSHFTWARRGLQLRYCSRQTQLQERSCCSCWSWSCCCWGMRRPGETQRMRAAANEFSIPRSPSSDPHIPPQPHLLQGGARCHEGIRCHELGLGLTAHTEEVGRCRQLHNSSEVRLGAMSG